jgi:uncharacterized protein involved in exopolysaccharide biosynthesis
MDIRFYLALLLRRLPLIMLFVLFGSALGGTVAMILPASYEARARLVVENQQIPDELAASTVRTATAEQIQIISQRILSRDVILELIDRFEIFTREERESLSPDELISEMRERIAIVTSGGQRRRNDYEPVFITVRFTASDANLSAAVTNEVVTQILRENVAMRTEVSGQTLEFFEREVERLDQELAERNAQITLFQEENRAALPESLDFRRTQMIQLRRETTGVDEEMARLRDRKRSLAALFERTGGLGNAELTPQERELQELRDRYAVDSSVLSEQNPRLVMMRQQIAAMEVAVAEQAESPTPSPRLDRTTSLYELQIEEIDTQIAALEQRRAQLDIEIEALDETIEATPANALTLSRLERDLENVRRQYDLAVAKRAEAETGDAIEALAKGQRISIIDAATAPDSPTSPNRRKIALTGFAGGLGAGLALIALLELTNRSVRRAVEIERALEITPIATLSYMRTSSEILRRRTMLAGAFVIAAAGMPATLWAVDTYYKPIDEVARQVLDRLPDISIMTDALDRAG